jgi:hypothetical protein
MKTVVRSVLFIGALLTGANGLMASQTSNRWFDQWYRSKFGRRSPAEEARQRTGQARTASRDEATPAMAAPVVSWIEQHWRTKFGRGSPTEEHKKERPEQADRVFGADTKAAPPVNNWLDQWHKTKFGRSSPNGRSPSKILSK